MDTRCVRRMRRIVLARKNAFAYTQLMGHVMDDKIELDIEI